MRKFFVPFSSVLLQNSVKIYLSSGGVDINVIRAQLHLSKSGCGEWGGPRGAGRRIKTAILHVKLHKPISLTPEAGHGQTLSRGF